MISTKWFQEKNLEDVLELRRNVFLEELNYEEKFIQDEYDVFAKNVVVYEDRIAIGTGRLIFKDRKYVIDKLCVKKEYRNKKYGDLIIRMLVRKAITIGAKQTYAVINNRCERLFNRIKFVKESSSDGRIVMRKDGDIISDCCGK